MAAGRRGPHLHQEKDIEVEWAQQHLQAHLAEKLLDGSFAPPAGAGLPQKDPPEEQVAGEVPRPQLTTLTFNESMLLDGLPTLTLPAQLQRKWTHAGGQHVFVEGVVASLSLHCAPCPSIKQHHQVVRLSSQSYGQGGGAIEPILCAMWVDQVVKVSF